MAINRKINIDVTFTVTDHAGGGFGGGAVYTQTSSTPDMGTLVDSDGSIHLDNAPTYDASQYNQNVDLEFTLISPSSGAHAFTIQWATQYGSGMTIEPPECGGTTGEMNVVFDSNHPNVITIEDKDDDNNVYNYKPALEIVRSGHNNYYISLDPRIVNRPRRT